METLNEIKLKLIENINNLPTSIDEINDLDKNKLYKLISPSINELYNSLCELQKSNRHEPRIKNNQITYWVSKNILNNINLEYNINSINVILPLLESEFYVRKIELFNDGFLFIFRKTHFHRSIYNYVSKNNELLKLNNLPNMKSFDFKIGESLHLKEPSLIIDSILNHYLKENVIIIKKSTYVERKIQ
jgi:hypothetical protein